MILLPAIDLIGGRVVRLSEGDFATTKVYHDDPLQQAQTFLADGATWLHVVDLDGARAGRPVQGAIIERIIEVTGLKVQVGGGLRAEEHLAALIQCGVTRCVLGSISVRDPDRVAGWLATFGAERILLAPDCRQIDGQWRVLVDGWETASAMTLWQYLDHYRAVGACAVMVTDVARDGRMEGPNLDLYRQVLARHDTLELIASGGVASLEDLGALEEAGLAGAIVGRALYEGRFGLSEALDALQT